jgi:phosphohistidine phosphatase
MKLYVARHGDYSMEMAQQMDVLTENGINEMTVLANFLSPLDIHVSNILHSGKFRAQQSAEILAKGFHCEQAVQLQAGLNPNDDVKAFANEISHWDTDVLIVSHLPFVGRLISELVTQNENHNLIDFKTGTFVCLEQLEHTRWIINWVLTPELFRE